MTSRLVVATHNGKKAGEMLTILGRRFGTIQLHTLADYPSCPEPEETGSTFEENAKIKAESALVATGEWCVADDAGLEIDALPGELGVYSKRFAGEATSFPEKMAIILDRMIGLSPEMRSARFRCAVALSRPGQETELFTATCEGRIALAPSGMGGFGYDPIFWLEEHGCTMADLSADAKHEISHRGKVLRALGDRLSILWP